MCEWSRSAVHIYGTQCGALLHVYMIQHKAVRLAWRAMHSGMEGDAFWHGGRCSLAWRVMHSGMEGDAFSLPFPILATRD